MTELIYILAASIAAGIISALPLFIFITWNEQQLGEMNRGLSTQEIFRKAAA